MHTTECPPRLGRLSATPAFLEAVPRDVMIRALRAHLHAGPAEAGPIETRHGWDGVLFRLRTSADRSTTSIRLEGE